MQIQIIIENVPIFCLLTAVWILVMVHYYANDTKEDRILIVVGCIGSMLMLLVGLGFTIHLLLASNIESIFV